MPTLVPATTEPDPQAHGPAARGVRGRVWLAIGLVALGVVVARVAVDARAALLAGEAALQSGDEETAARELQHAVRMYFPGSPFVTRALAGLDQLAAAARAAGDLPRERRALEAVRAGLLGARSLYTPHGARLSPVDARLAELYVALEDPAVAAGATTEARLAFHRERLARRPGAGPGASLLALLGFGLWLGAAVSFFRGGLDEALVQRPRWALWCGLAFLSGLTLFVTGLRLA